MLVFIFVFYFKKGNSRWVHAMEWSGTKEFGASPELPFEVSGSEAGLLKTYGPLSFIKVWSPPKKVEQRRILIY